VPGVRKWWLRGGFAAGLLLVIVLIVRAATPAPRAPEVPSDAELTASLGDLAEDIQRTFARVFAAEGHAYRDAALQVVEGDVTTGCGRTESLIGFYCALEETAYVDLSFYRALRQRFGDLGDFALAYVVAHELGHHVQEIFGTHDRVDREAALEPARAGDLAQQLELQADCYAGVWAHATGRRALVDGVDLDAGLAAAATIATGRAAPADDGAAGQPDPRLRWFRLGLERGSLAVCDTFAAAPR
jgi:predicted metalloprotease